MATYTLLRNTWRHCYIRMLTDMLLRNTWRNCYLNSVAHYNMYNIHPSSPSLPTLPPSIPPSLSPSLPPSLPLPSHPLPLVTQQIHCPFQPKQSPSNCLTTVCWYYTYLILVCNLSIHCLNALVVFQFWEGGGSGSYVLGNICSWQWNSRGIFCFLCLSLWFTTTFVIPISSQCKNRCSHNNNI